MTNPGTTDLLAWWSLEETSGTREDSHTGNRDMSALGSPSYTTGKVGNAGTVTVVNGNTNYFRYNDTGNVFDCPAGVSLTVACWVYLNNATSNVAYPMARWGNTGDWYVYISSTGVAGCGMRQTGSNADAVTPSSTIAATTWYFLVGQFDHTVGTYGTVYISVNAGTQYSTALASAKVAESGRYVNLGSLGVAFGNMTGRIDEACIYQRVLTADEIAWLYNAGNGRSYSDLTAAETIPQSLAGVLAGAGVTARRPAKSPAGILSATGDMIRRPAKSLAGILSSSGALSQARVALRALVGSLSAAGELVRNPAKSLAGILSAAGEMVRGKVALRALAGSLAGTGELVRRPAKSLAGMLSAAGVAARRPAKSLAGSLSASGTIGRAQAYLVSLAGVLSAAGEAARRLLALGEIYLVRRLTVQARTLVFTVRERVYQFRVKDR